LKEKQKKIEKKQLNVRLNKDLIDHIKVLAIRNGLPLDQYVSRILVRHSLEHRRYE